MLRSFLDLIYNNWSYLTYSSLTLLLLQNVKTFKDVKGCDDAKQELEEVVEYLKNPTKFTRLGGKLPKVCARYIFIYNRNTLPCLTCFFLHRIVQHHFLFSNV